MEKSSSSKKAALCPLCRGKYNAKTKWIYRYCIELPIARKIKKYDDAAKLTICIESNKEPKHRKTDDKYYYTLLIKEDVPYDDCEQYFG